MMSDKEKRIRAANHGRKKYLIQRINEILDDYLMDDEEDYCLIEMKFKKGEEHQEKTLIYRRITD